MVQEPPVHPIEVRLPKHDHRVPVTDLLLLMDAWGPCPIGGCIGDLDRDGVVGIADLLLLLDAW